MKNYKHSSPQSKTYSMVLHYICPSLLVDMIVGAGLVLVQGVWYKVGLFFLAAFIELSVAIMLQDS